MSTTGILINARAAGVSGRRNGKTLDAQAAGALPHSGGTHSSKNTLSEFEGCTWNSSESQLTSYFDTASKTYKTDVVCSIEKLVINGRVKVDAINTEVHVTYNPNGPSPRSPSIQASCKISGLQIDKQSIDVVSLESLYRNLDTLDSIRDKHLTDAQFRNQIHSYCMVGQIAQLTSSQLQGFFPYCQGTTSDVLKENRFGTTLPLVRVNHGSGDGFQVSNNAIHIDGFGSLLLGRMVVTATDRFVTGFHIDFDPPPGGPGECITCCDLGGGTPEINPP